MSSTKSAIEFVINVELGLHIQTSHLVCKRKEPKVAAEFAVINMRSSSNC
jgi:hypothetical protein